MLKYIFILVTFISFVACSDDVTSDVNIKNEWRDEKSYKEPYNFGLLNAGVIEHCRYHFSKSIEKEVDTNTLNTQNILGYIYKNISLSKKNDRIIGECTKIIMNKYTPLDIVNIVKSGDDKEYKKSLKHIMQNLINYN